MPLLPPPPSRWHVRENKTNVFTKPAEMCSNLTQSWDFDTPEAEALDEGMMLRRSVDAAGRPAGRKQKPPWGLEPAVPEVPLTKSNAGFHRRGGGEDGERQ